MQERLSYITYMGRGIMMNQSNGGTNPFNYGDIFVVVDYARVDRDTYYNADMQWVVRCFPINIIVELQKSSKYIDATPIVIGQKDSKIRFNLFRTYCGIRLATPREQFLYHLHGSNALISEEEE